MSLVTVARYQAITGDTTTATSAVEDYLDEAAELLAEDLGRPLAEAERVESVWPDPAGWLWPAATPIVEAADGWSIYGHGLTGGQRACRPGEPVELTYTGGWVERTANPDAANRLPVVVERDLAWAAWALGHVDEVAASIPRGATAVAVGDINITLERAASGARDDLTVAWSRRTLRHRRRGF